MVQRESYNTKQKKLILEIISKQKNNFTVKELFSEISKKDQTIGLTTVYRAINNLVSEHVLVKNVDRGGILKYHKLEECNNKGHCFLKCESCGKMTHADCAELDTLSSHFANKHHFKIDQKDITIYGFCENCRG